MADTTASAEYLAALAKYPPETMAPKPGNIDTLTARTILELIARVEELEDLLASVMEVNGLLERPVTDVERLACILRRAYLEPVMATIREIAAEASPEMLELVPALKEVRDQLPERSGA